jgi:hypothetical protein
MGAHQSGPMMDKMLITKKGMAPKRRAKARRKKRPKDAICGGYNS